MLYSTWPRLTVTTMPLITFICLKCHFIIMNYYYYWSNDYTYTYTIFHDAVPQRHVGRTPEPHDVLFSSGPKGDPILARLSLYTPPLASLRRIWAPIRKDWQLTTGFISGDRARTIGRPKADTTMQVVMNTFISMRALLVLSILLAYRREIMVGTGDNK